MSQDKLIIFVRNPEPGKVKTRLAKSVGDQEALRIYKSLLDYTKKVVLPLNCKKVVYYSSFIPGMDLWEEHIFEKRVQKGNGLGEKMKKALSDNYSPKSKLVLIGSDCAELTTEIIRSAFTALNHNEMVIGPAKDGGYYLIGMNTINPKFFENIDWGTNKVLQQTLKKVEEASMAVQLLPELNDVDVLEDWLLVKDRVLAG